MPKSSEEANRQYQQSQILNKRVGSGGGRDSDMYRPDKLANAHQPSGSRSSNKSSSTCFVRGTSVQVQSGVVSIELLRPGDTVLTVHPNTGRRQLRRVILAQSYRDQPIWELRLASGRHIQTTANHRFRSVQGWSSAEKLVAGDQILVLRPDGSSIFERVDRSASTSARDEVFNIIVEGEANFIADGALASSFCTFPRVKELLCRLVAFLTGPVTTHQVDLSAKPLLARL